MIDRLLHLNRSRGAIPLNSHLYSLPGATLHRQPLARLCAGLIAMALMSCSGEPNRRWPDWQNGAGDDSMLFVERDDRTCVDCIALRPTIHIAIDSGPGLIDEARAVTVDSTGRIWVGTGRGIKIYSADGSYVRTLGRSGDGPGEFRAPGPIFTADSGRVRFIDQVTFRETSFDYAFTLLGVRTLPSGPIFDVDAIDPRGDTLIVNAEFYDVERVGYPAHIMTEGRVLHSFAMPQDSLFDARTENMLRKVAVLPSGSYAIASLYTYEVEIYNRDRRRVLRFRRPGLWPPPPGGVPGPLSTDTELHGFVQDIQADSQGRLWVLSWEPRDDWRQNVVERLAPDGTRLLMQKDSRSALRRSRIDLIDLQSGALVATTTHEAMIWGFAARGRLYGYTYAPTDEPRLEVYDVSLISKR